MAEATTSGPAWDLSGEYADADDPQIAADLQSVEALLGEIERLNAELTGSKRSLDAQVAAAAAIHELEEQASEKLANVSTFANCLLSVNSRDAAAQKLQGSLQRYFKRAGDALEPLSQFVQLADDATIEKFLADPRTAPARFQVLHSRDRRHELLSLQEESLVNGLSQDGIHAWGNLYDQLSGSIECSVLTGNESRTMGLAQAAGLLRSSDDVQRREAWRGINAAWTTHEEATAAALNAISGWRLEMARKRSVQQPVHYLDAPVHMNRLTRDTLDTLMGVAAAARPLAQRAAKLQARAHGKKAFAPWDLQAPAPVLNRESGNRPIAFEDAITTIAGAYGEVDAGLGAFVQMMVERRWIEGTVGPHKRPGAYCTRFYKSRTPRVYMTYMGSASDVITLAHELGHAYHGWVMRDLPQSQQSYGMSLAETASTFGETLVRDSLFRQSHTAAEKLQIAWEDLSALTAFLLNIPARFQFENDFYQARDARPLRPDEIRALMSKAWNDWYGDALAEPDPMFWASKLHFYISGISFYNFPYLFGYLFSLGLYARRDAMGADFFPAYNALLKDTGRMTAESLARTHLGAELSEPGFWRDTIDSLEARVDGFEALLDELDLVA